MKHLRIPVLLAIFVLWGANASAQRFLWNADFDFRFDNKEYASVKNDLSVTNFTVRLTPQIGIGWGKEGRHALLAGIDLLNDFGKDTYVSRQMICYYRYTDTNYGVWFGRFPRRNLIGTYSNAFFSDYVSYYDSNLDGLAAHYVNEHGYVELVLDWDSMLADNQREKFMIFSAGQGSLGAFYGGYNMSMYHHAGSVQERGVVDNILLYPYAGADFAKYAPAFAALYLQVGWLQSFQNDRRYIGHFVKPGGLQVEARIQRWGFGIYNTLYLGDNLMPYYTGTVDGQPDYGGGLYKGEPFYRTDHGIYNRLELYWQHMFGSAVAFKVSSIHHYDGSGWGWQQQLELEVYLSEKMFRHPRPVEK